MKKLLCLALLIFTVFSVGVAAEAAVISTEEPTAGAAVYVAGNPALYPLEFYNEKTKSYEGILPKLYEEISRQTGLEFAYVAADREDRQQELGENCQVELVSAYEQGTVAVAKELELFSYEKDGETVTVCIGFTKIAGPQLVAEVEAAVQAADKHTWLAAAMKLEGRPQVPGVALWLAAAVGVLLVVVVVLTVRLVKHRRRGNEQQAQKLNDPLTGIGNLAYFEDCYAHHLPADMRSLYYVAYVALDIKKIETYFGQAESEELQRYAASTLVSAMGDTDFAARIDNGVFAACFLCPDTERALAKAAELVRTLNEYKDGHAGENDAAFRCGVFPLDKQQLPAETVLYNARQGYLYAENEGQNVCLCDKQMLGRVAMKSRLQKKISAAIEQEEFQLYLQFIFDTDKRTLCGAEVLSRWHSPEEGVLSPANYIEDMKVAGMIDKLDLYVFEKTCALLQAWRGTVYEGLYLSCNFTRTTLSKADFAEQFEAVLSRYAFDREKLLVELTEDSLVSDSAVAYKNILAIKKLGCRIALDDFGSGYTSFSDLCDYPIDVIKIDRHIVIKASDSRGYAVLTGIIRMAHALDIRVLCEGVETELENHKVTEAECDLIQGFLYSRVLPVENALEFYKTKQ